MLTCVSVCGSALPIAPITLLPHPNPRGAMTHGELTKLRKGGRTHYQIGDFGILEKKKEKHISVNDPNPGCAEHERSGVRPSCIVQRHPHYQISNLYGMDVLQQVRISI